jgi:ketosteroid isomerase-like protein
VALGDADAIRSLYGIDWTGVTERAQGLAAAAEVMAPDVVAHISPQVGDRTLRGVADFAVFVEGLEEDFSVFRYDVDSVEETGSGQFVLRGVIHARGRRSKMPLSSPFTHVWTFRDGRAIRVEANMGPPPAN